MPNAIEVMDERIAKALEVPKLEPLKKVYAGVGEMAMRLGKKVIKNEADYDASMVDMKDGKALVKELEGAKDVILKTPEGFVKSVKALCKEIVSPLDILMDDRRRTMQDYQTKQEEARYKAAEALRLKKIEEEKKLEVADTGKQVAKIEAKIEKIVETEQAILDYKPKTADKVRKFLVEKPDLVDRKYCSPEDAKIRPFIGKVGDPVPEIAGVKIWDEIKIVTR